MSDTGLTYEIIDNMIGQTFTSVVADSDTLTFTQADGRAIWFYHNQDCCESVSLEDIVGELADLENAPLLMAETASNGTNETVWGSETWTFYKFATVKGYVTVRWYGSSNGYYSESVDMRVINP
jgi:hypothetical protein